MIAERLAATPTFRLLVASRAMPPTPYLRKLGEFPCEYSWNLAGVDVHACMCTCACAQQLDAMPPNALQDFHSLKKLVPVFPPNVAHLQQRSKVLDG